MIKIAMQNKTNNKIYLWTNFTFKNFAGKQKLYGQRDKTRITTW